MIHFSIFHPEEDNDEVRHRGSEDGSTAWLVLTAPEIEITMFLSPLKKAFRSHYSLSVSIASSGKVALIVAFSTSAAAVKLSSSQITVK
jgi:hypothetical protein